MLDEKLRNLNHSAIVGRRVLGRARRTYVQPLSVVLGTTEEWTVTNTIEMDHPFHLQGFRSEITDVDGAPPPLRALQDTINVGPMQTVTLRVPLDGRPGTWRFHCHILEHAERGMMGELDVTEP